MKEETFKFQSKDGMEIFTFKWQPEDMKTIPLKGIVQIVHGSVEHAERYKNFAKELTQNGFIVYANDHRGHGKTADSIDNLSYFSDEDNGWDLAVEDLYTVTQLAKKEHPDLPLFIIGHSMGSFLLREYICRYGEKIDGAILSGTAGGLMWLVKLMKFLSKQFILFKGRKTYSPLLHYLIFGNLNKKIKDTKTDFDFLSRDKSEVRKYIDDPYCGHTVTSEYAYQMACGLEKIYENDAFEAVPKSLPIYLFSGGNDPVGGKNGKDVINVYKNYKKAGVQDISMKLYPDARHETINEINRDEVYKDVIGWLNSRAV